MSGQTMQVPFAYLTPQFAESEQIFDELRQLVATGDYTLGKAVWAFEERLAGMLGVKHVVTVNSGTDALKLTLEALGIGPGDGVITSANTFIATVGAIAAVGAHPVFVDCDDGLCIDPDKVEAAITPETRCLMPVHLSGNVADLDRLMPIAERHGLEIVEDACQALMSLYDGKAAGTIGRAGCYSFHPMKFLNIWGDGGAIVTDDDALADKLRLLRNHGLVDRDTVTIMGYNSRLDTAQAVVANRVLDTSDSIVSARSANAAFYDEGLAGISQIRIPPRDPKVRHTFVTYQVFAQDRDALLAFCVERGVDAKVHYPVPLYQQEGLRRFGYKAGDFPVTDRHAAETITLPVHQYLTQEQLAHVVDTVRAFYDGRDA